jgi:hypothetical protein
MPGGVTIVRPAAAGMLGPDREVDAEPRTVSASSLSRYPTSICCVAVNDDGGPDGAALSRLVMM